jgi:hypothetical protein
LTITLALADLFPSIFSLHQCIAHFGGHLIASSQGIDARQEASDILIAMKEITDRIYV